MYIFLGVSSERRTNELKRLNNTYLEVVASRTGLKECLDHMIETESYRWICKATYSINPQPIRSERNFERESQSETTFVQDSVIIEIF